ncbi:MAG: ABC transporter substrate-binding protein [Myxococcaceae bacterium]|nr:ABC transporter substrate-binding protein [Myxococcaceae bacterium]
MRVARRIGWLGALGVSALVGCRGCDKPAVVDAGTPGPSTAWLEGRLPPETGQPRDGGTLVVRLPVEPKGFTRIDDTQAEGTMVRAITGTVYETLGRVDDERPEGPLRPWLAESWKGLETFTVTLAPQLQFHDGQPCTAADFKAVLDVILDEKNPTVAMRSALGPIDSVQAPDARTLVVRWKRYSPFFHRALLGAVPAMPASALRGEFGGLAIHRAPIGTGPFRVERFVPGARLELVRHVDARGPRAHLERLVFEFVKDDLVATQRWEKGDFDVITRIPPAAWRAVEQAPWAFTGYQRVRFDENAYAFIAWNLSHPALSDVRVRRALAQLYPAEVISRVVELGLEARTTCPFLRTSASCHPDVAPLPFDPRAAAALLDEAGWRDTDGDGVRERDGQPLVITFLAVTQSQRQAKLLPLYQEALGQAGVRLVLEPVDASQLVARLRTHDFEAAALAWSSPDAVSDQYDLFHSSQADGGKNYVGLRDESIDALVEAIRAEPDPLERPPLERQLHKLVFAQQPYLFLTSRPVLDALKVRVHGLRPTLGGYDFARAWVEP